MSAEFQQRYASAPAEPDELLFLRYFYDRAASAMGPADDDIYWMIKDEFVEDSGLQLPPSYRREEEDE